MTDGEGPEAGSAEPSGRAPFTAAELAALGPEDGSRPAPPDEPHRYEPRRYGAPPPAPADRPHDQHPTAPLQRPVGYGTGEPAGPPARPGGDVHPHHGGAGPYRPAGQHPSGPAGSPPAPRSPYPAPSSAPYRPSSPYQTPAGYEAPSGRPAPPQHAPGSPPPPGGRAPYPGAADRPSWSPPGAGFPPAPPQRPGYGQGPQPFPADPFPPQRRPRRRVPALVLVAAVVVTALVCGALGGVAGGVVQARRDKPTGSPSPSVPADSIGAVVKQVLPSVVSVIVPQSDGSEFVGAGSIISRDGYIMTNEHVVSTTKADGAKVKVELNSGEEVDASVKGMSSTADIAVLKVDRTGLRPITFGDSRKVQVGDRVIAVGNPLGLAETTTSGIVSALNRPVHVSQHSDSYYAAIQTDAAINPGNSGGPLFDINGRLIGVNYAGAAKQNVGLGFAIPGRSAQRTAQQLIRTGRSTHAVIGVYTDTRYSGDGAKIATSAVDGKEPVTAGGPADKAGLQAGDVITKVAGVPIHSSSGLTAIIRTQAPGDVVSAVYERSGSPTTTKMTLGEQADQ